MAANGDYYKLGCLTKPGATPAALVNFYGFLSTEGAALAGVAANRFILKDLSTSVIAGSIDTFEDTWASSREGIALPKATDCAVMCAQAVGATFVGGMLWSEET